MWLLPESSLWSLTKIIEVLYNYFDYCMAVLKYSISSAIDDTSSGIIMIFNIYIYNIFLNILYTDLFTFRFVSLLCLRSTLLIMQIYSLFKNKIIQLSICFYFFKVKSLFFFNSFYLLYCLIDGFFLNWNCRNWVFYLKQLSKRRTGNYTQKRNTNIGFYLIYRNN